MNWTEFFVLKRQPPSMVRIGVLGVLYDVHKLDPMLNMKHCKLFMLKTMLVKPRFPNAHFATLFARQIS